ncbi:lipid A biosynthesis acyltransferase [Chitinophaga sp. 30R24]|uniref:LpxL/LpxP family acyltransferase n=1 Tax=Chitinophaga sp. 30R24 TaxID=3248838 RepID=UPI003B9009FF
MPSWEGKSKGSKFGYSCFVFLLKHGGVLPAYLLLRFVACYYFIFSWSSSKPIYHYFRTKVGYSRWRALWALYRNYYVFGQTLIDKVVVMADIPNSFTFEFEGEHYLREMIAGSKGGILLSAHLGNWEVAGHLFKRLQTRVNIVMFDGEHQRIKTYLSGVTGDRNMNIIVIKDDLSHIYAINEALSNQELVCMHADRFLPGNKTETLSFLGKDARFPMGPFLLAATFRVPVSVVFAFKESSRHYHFYATAPRLYHGRRNEGVTAALQDFTREVAEKVRRYPVQWFNYYNFWE